MCRAAGRPFPTLSDDPVIDYLVMEAVALKVTKEDAEAEKEAEKRSKHEQFKKGKVGDALPDGVME